MRGVQRWTAILALFAGLILGIPQLYTWLSSALGGPWAQLLLGWATVVSIIIAFFERS